MAKSRSIKQLCDAIEQGSLKKVRELVDAGVALDETDTSRKLTPLTTAIDGGRTEIAILLLQRGASPTARPTGFRKDKPLHLACRMGNHEIAKRLLDLGVNVNDVMKPHNDPAGRTPLMDAAISGNIELIELLIDAGAKLDAVDEAGITAAGWATHEAARDFLAKKIDELPLDTSPGQLAAAVRDGRIERVHALLEAGAQVDDRDPNGETALMLAVFRLDLKIAKLLIEHGADVNYRTERGKRPLTSHPNMKTRMAKLLLQNGADPNAETTDGRTAMRWAVGSATKLQVKAMFEAGGQLNLNSEEQEKLLEFVRRYNRGVLPLLQERFGAEEQPTDRIRAHVKEFARLMESEEFAVEAQRIGKVVNRKPAKWKKRKGVYYFYNVSVVKHLAKYFDETVDSDDFDAIERLFSHFNAEVLERGFILIMTGMPSDKGRCSLLLFPTNNKYAVIAAVGTNGANYGLNSDDIISWLMEMERENPFRLTDAGHDTLGGTFTQPVTNAAGLATRMAEFCPDVTNFAASSPDEWSGEEIVATMSETMKKDQMFEFWWD